MLKAGFIILTLILAIIICAGMFYAANKVFFENKERTAFKIKVVLFIAAWLSYISIMSLNMVFVNPSLPPRITFLLVIPSFGFVIYFFRNAGFKPVIAAVPLSWVIYFQTFRIVVELLLFSLFMQHMLPWSATLEGYNFDIGIGITAPFIGYLVAKGRLYKRTIRAWNYVGIVMFTTLALILTTHAYYPWLWHESETILGKGFGTFPYTFFAGFFFPSGIFMHIFALVKIRKMVPVQETVDSLP